MSGIVGSKLNIRGSGRIAKLGTDGQVLTSAGAGVSAVYEDAAGGGLDWQSVTTGSTLAAVAGNGYPIDTTSNICTITLPASPSVGDEIIFTDYAGTWSTYSIFLDPNGLNYQSRDDTWTVEYNTDDQVLHIVYIDATQGWMPILDKAVIDEVPYLGNDEGIFGFGNDGSVCDITNLVSNAGVVASDVTGVGTARRTLKGCEYGGDKGIFGYGYTDTNVSITNLVSNAGVVASDQAATTGTVRGAVAGYADAYASMTNLVTNAGVVGSDVAGVGTAKANLAACEYGTDTAIFGYGTGSDLDETNLVSNAGVVSTDVTGVGTARGYLAACSYGGDKGIFGLGYAGGYVSMTNLVSNTGVVATDTTGVGTARRGLAACEYSGSKGIFGFGKTPTNVGMTNLVSNAGVVASDVAAVGTARNELGACSFN